MNEIKEIAEGYREFVKERDWERFQTPRNLVMALSAEVGELVELFMWLDEDQASSLQAHQCQAVSEEIGDVFLYLLRLSDVLGIDLVQAAQEKMKMNRVKHTPETCKPLDKVYPKKR